METGIAAGQSGVQGHERLAKQLTAGLWNEPNDRAYREGLEAYQGETGVPPETPATCFCGARKPPTIAASCVRVQ